jgi:NAD(P)-dependent dehydrogenase (short-subunit alcohol dehydrogenase family)
LADAPLPTPLCVLVVGGTGAFGERLVTGILETTGFDVVVAGRNQVRLAAFVAHCNRTAAPGGRARAAFLTLDVRSVTPGAIKGTGAFAVVDAASPYQGGDYGLARAAIAAGLHYIDLADARDFVMGFGVLDAAARAAGVVALTGASSTPALSNAALDKLTAGWSRVDRVEVAISPGNRAPRGLSVVRSILSYAGRPVRVFAEGRWCERPGWGMTMRREMPGLGRRWLSLAETPDLDIVPDRFAVQRSAVFRAGLELSVLHLGLLTASLLVRAGVLRSLAPMARVFRAMAAVFQPLGTDRGGMLAEAVGLDREERPVRGLWSLVAEEGDGPYVPTLPALAALRALADGRLVRPGASACVGVLSLEEIEAKFRPYRITSSTRWERPSPSLYEIVLGDAFRQLPEPLRRLHRPGWGMWARGMARVDGLASALVRFPPMTENVPVSVAITPGPGRERWARDFGGKRFTSVLSASATPGRVVERFGPFSFELDLAVGPEGVLGMPVRAWRLGPLLLPRVLAPVSIATEGVDEQGRFRFDVEVRLPLGLGRLVRYRGWLVPSGAQGGVAYRAEPAYGAHGRTHDERLRCGSP